MKTVLNFPYLRLFWVMALGVDSSVRMIAGTFSDANWISVNSSLPGADSTIFAAVEDSAGNLYVGGHFSVVGDVFANQIAKWVGTNWQALGSGMNGDVLALALSGNDLYAGGNFTSAGGKVSTYIARAYLPPLPTLSVLRSSTNMMVSWPSADTAGFALEQSVTLAGPITWVTNTTITDDGTNKSMRIPAKNSAQYLRLRRP